jgi:hypothetical protein
MFLRLAIVRLGIKISGKQGGLELRIFPRAYVALDLEGRRWRYAQARPTQPR